MFGLLEDALNKDKCDFELFLGSSSSFRRLRTHQANVAAVVFVASQRGARVRSAPGRTQNKSIFAQRDVATSGRATVGSTRLFPTRRRILIPSAGDSWL